VGDRDEARAQLPSGGVAIAYSLAYTARSATEPGVRRLWAEFPKFLLGFLAVAAVANSGLLSPAALESIGRVSDALFTLAFVGLGLSIRLREMREVGGPPSARSSSTCSS